MASVARGHLELAGDVDGSLFQTARDATDVPVTRPRDDDGSGDEDPMG